jgi:hypothetical protein
MRLLDAARKTTTMVGLYAMQRGIYCAWNPVSEREGEEAKMQPVGSPDLQLDSHRAAVSLARLT